MKNKNRLPVLLIGLIVIILTGCSGGGGSTGGGNNINNTGIVTLSWSAPTTNTDGTPLTDLAGYNVYYGPSSGNYTNSYNAGMSTSYTINNLPAGTYYFVVTAYNAAGYASTFSNEASKTI